MKYLLDTDHMSILQNRSGSDFAVLSVHMARHSADVAACIVSFLEQALGANKYISQAKTPAELEHGYGMASKLLSGYSPLPVLPFTVADVAVFNGLRAQRIRISTMDLRIASIGLVHGLTVITRNLRDFQQVPGLMIENWTV